MQPTTTRVEASTAAGSNEAIRQDSEQRIAAYIQAEPQAIEQRLRELDREWTTERIIETEAPLMVGLGVLLGLTKDRRWFGLSAVSASMVILHNLQGWYPLLPILRRLGVRSQNEIEQERYALRVLRGEHSRHPTRVSSDAASTTTVH